MGVKRTKLCDRHLPRYTKGEELANMISHIAGAAFGVCVLLLCLLQAVRHHNTPGIVGSTVYGASMIVLYTMSSIYHGLRAGTAKRVFQVLDHCTIYFLIAGSYTPIALGALLREDALAAWLLLGIVWTLTAFATVFTAIDLHRHKVLSMICYIGTGWCALFFIRTMVNAITLEGFWLLILGGVLYTVGAILYGLGKKWRYIHFAFHIFVLLGSFFQFLCIWRYAL